MTERRSLIPPSARGAYGPRLVALALACLAMASLRAQFDVLAATTALGPALWLMALFFTVLTNLGVVLHMLAVAWGWRISAARAAGLVVSIVFVALVYHAVLARLWAPEGLQWWADQGLHSAVPLGTVLWWAVLAPKGVSRRDMPGWMVWPLVYCAYALIRGAVSGVWPYPFLDADALGWLRVTGNIAVLIALFAALGAGLIWADGRLRALRQGRQEAGKPL